MPLALDPPSWSIVDRLVNDSRRLADLGLLLLRRCDATVTITVAEMIMAPLIYIHTLQYT